MEKKIFYRLANLKTQQGLWYDYEGHFTGLIHSEFKFCLNNKLTMPFDPDVIGWLSATDSLETLLDWFPIEDQIRLKDFGYSIVRYEATDYRFYENHWLINQQTSKILT